MQKEQREREKERENQAVGPSCQNLVMIQTGTKHSETTQMTSVSLQDTHDSFTTFKVTTCKDTPTGSLDGTLSQV